MSGSQDSQQTSDGLMGLLGAAAMNKYIVDSAKLLVLGTLLEVARRVWFWLAEHVKLRYTLTAQIDSNDPAYKWITLLLTQENVWRKTRSFKVVAKTSHQRWSVKLSPDIDEDAEYVPSYSTPHLFRWRGTWVEIRMDDGLAASGRSNGIIAILDQSRGSRARSTGTGSSLYVTMFTLDMSKLTAFVKDARGRYVKLNADNITIHSSEGRNYGRGWTDVKTKKHRPLNSLALEEGVMDGLLADVREFFEMEQWYADAGIPWHRGYLLAGPPGTGKTSTIYALAGELGLEIYIISLAGGGVDDTYLQRLASSVPKRSIMLIEDVDCAFPSRDEDDDENAEDAISNIQGQLGLPGNPRIKSAVTMSGLLNCLDGVGSDDGKLFFATTNYIDRLDEALLRPGRIDKILEYSLATRYQSQCMYDRFFPEQRFSAHLPALGDVARELLKDEGTATLDSPLAMEKPTPSLSDFSTYFAASVPPGEFSTAELQGYLLAFKKEPVLAALGVKAWVKRSREDKKVKKGKEEERKQRKRDARARVTMKQGERAITVIIADGKVVAQEESSPAQEPTKSAVVAATPLVNGKDSNSDVAKHVASSTANG